MKGRPRRFRTGSQAAEPEMSMVESRFADRRQAGEMLAAELSAQLAQHVDLSAAMVLALPRGGVPVGFAIAQALHLPLDVLMVRKLGMPGHEEFAMGAITSDGIYVLRDDMVLLSGAQAAAIEETGRREMQELRRREELYRDERPLLAPQGRTAIIVDDGMATGSTMLAAVRALRSLHPACVIAAVPVAAPDAHAMVAREVDAIVCLAVPEHFRAVSLWYDDFSQTTDDEVRDLLRQAAQQHRQWAVPDAGTRLPARH
jgi:putative phosphoribosyl transferase